MKKLSLILVLAAAASVAQVPSPQVPITGNIGSGGVFPLLNSGTLVFSLDADHTMVYPETSAAVLKITSSVSLTATRTLVAPLGLGYAFTIYNATTGGQTINVCGTSGTCAAIPNDGAPHLVSCDGANYFLANAVPSGGVTAISVASANGLQGTSSGGSTPQLTISPDSTHCIPVNNASAGTFLNGSCAYSSPAGSGVAQVTPGANVTCTPLVGGSCTGSITINAATSPGTITGVMAGTGLTGGGTTGTVTVGLATPVAVTNGGTGTASPGLIAGSNVTITGAWPNQTVSAASSVYNLGGTITSANISLGPGAGTGASVALAQGLDGSHIVEVTTGTSPTSSSHVYDLTFSTSRGHSTYCVVQENASAASSPSQLAYAAGGSSTSYTMESGSTALQASHTYLWSISCP